MVIVCYSYMNYRTYQIQLQLLILSNILYIVIVCYSYIYYRKYYIQLQLLILPKTLNMVIVCYSYMNYRKYYIQLQLHILSKILYIVEVTYAIQNYIYGYSMLQLHHVTSKIPSRFFRGQSSSPEPPWSHTPLGPLWEHCVTRLWRWCPMNVRVLPMPRSWQLSLVAWSSRKPAENPRVKNDNLPIDG